jgi:lipid A 3-O-deacylase
LKNLYRSIKKNTLNFLSVSLILNLLTANSYASTHGVQIAYGSGDPDHLKGYRVAIQQFWPWIGFATSRLNITGYWDLSYANWYASPPLAYQPRAIRIFALSPLVRLQSREAWLLFAQTYLELGIGASLLSHNHFGHRNLGGQFAFQDLMGLGLRWQLNQTTKATLSYHYLHYSNASLFPPNQGIDVKHLFTLGYEF